MVNRQKTVGLFVADGKVAKSSRLASLQDLLAARFAVQKLSPSALKNRIAPEIDVVLFPGGTAKKQASALGPDGQDAVRTFVESGKGYVGICAGAWLARNAANRLRLVDVQSSFGSEGTSYRGQQRQVVVRISGDQKAREILGDLSAPSHGYMKYVIAVYRGGPMFLRPKRRSGKVIEFVATFVEDYSGLRKGKDERVQEGAGAIVATEYGEGRVLLISPHFESRKTVELNTFVLNGIEWAAK